MTNVRHRNAPRGTVHAPTVTMDHVEAVALKADQDARFAKSNGGAVWAVAVMLCAWLIVAGIPAWIVGATNDSVIGFWATFFGITAALALAVTCAMRSSN